MLRLLLGINLGSYKERTNTPTELSQQVKALLLLKMVPGRASALTEAVLVLILIQMVIASFPHLVGSDLTVFQDLLGFFVVIAVWGTAFLVWGVCCCLLERGVCSERETQPVRRGDSF